MINSKRKVLTINQCDDVPDSGIEFQFEIPGVIKEWLIENPSKRVGLSEKLRWLADRCDSCEWPFEDKYES